MKKSEFFVRCQTSATGEDMPRLYVSQGFVYRSLDRAVFLHGCWANGSILTVELYRPSPARQHRDFQGMHQKLNEAESRFRRWLDEYAKTT